MNVHSKILAIVILVALPLLVGGCGITKDSIPPEAAQSAVLLEKAAKQNAQARGKLFATLATNMGAMHDKQLELILDVELAKAARFKVLPLTQPDPKDPEKEVLVGVNVTEEVDGELTEDEVKALYALLENQRKHFEEELEVERRKWLDDPNLEYEIALAEVMSEYAQSLDSFARRLERVASKIGLEPKETP